MVYAHFDRNLCFTGLATFAIMKRNIRWTKIIIPHWDINIF